MGINHFKRKLADEAKNYFNGSSTYIMDVEVEVILVIFPVMNIVIPKINGTDFKL